MKKINPSLSIKTEGGFFLTCFISAVLFVLILLVLVVPPLLNAVSKRRKV